MGIWKKIFGGAANDVIDNVGNLVDKFVQTPDERSLFKKQMYSPVVSDAPKLAEEAYPMLIGLCTTLIRGKSNSFRNLFSTNFMFNL